MPIMGGGGAAFNGGTITRPLTIDTGGTGTELSVQGTHTDLTIDGFAELFLNGDRGVLVDLEALGASNTVTLHMAGTDGGSADLSTGSGLTLADAGGTVFNLGNGEFLFGGLNSAPNSAFLSAGQCALWFDQTDGAAKLMVKAKTANGTVVTGSLALA